MSKAPLPTLSATFATELPEMSYPWQAAKTGNPEVVVLNETLATQLQFDKSWLLGNDGVKFLSGEHLPETCKPVAQVYSGHQFGWYSPRLGDGRALLLGEITAADGQFVDLHLKGSGRTPLARGGDGYAVLGPMLREFIVSEAMHALGIPSTRALAVVSTGNTVQREGPERGAVLARVAQSHLRVGSFQYARNLADPTVLRRLADHAIHRHYPNAA